MGSSFFFTLKSGGPISAKAGEVSSIKTAEPDESVMIANVLLVDDRDADILMARAFLSGPRGIRCNYRCV